MENKEETEAVLMKWVNAVEGSFPSPKCEVLRYRPKGTGLSWQWVPHESFKKHSTPFLIKNYEVQFLEEKESIPLEAVIIKCHCTGSLNVKECKQNCDQAEKRKLFINGLPMEEKKGESAEQSILNVIEMLGEPFDPIMALQWAMKAKKQLDQQLQPLPVSTPDASEKYKTVNHHHELTDQHEMVDFGDGEFVANKAAVPLLKALNEVGLRTRSHHIDSQGSGFVCILLDNAEASIQTVSEIHSDRTKYNGKKELLIQWGPSFSTGKDDVSAEVTEEQYFIEHATKYYQDHWADNANSVSSQPVIEAYCFAASKHGKLSAPVLTDKELEEIANKFAGEYSANDLYAKQGNHPKSASFHGFKNGFIKGKSNV